MATSEYIPENEAPSGNSTFVSSAQPRSHVGFGASLLAPLPMVVNDGIAILIAVAAALLIRAAFLHTSFQTAKIFSTIGNDSLAALYLAWFVSVYVVVARRYGLYGRILKNSNGAHELRLTAQASLTAGMLLCGLLYMVHNRDISRELVLLLTVSAMVSLCTRRAVWRMRRYRQYENGIATRRAVIVGTNHLAYALGRQIRTQSRLGYTLGGFILAPGSEPPAQAWGCDVLGDLRDLRPVVRKYFIDEVIIADSCPVEQVIRLLKEARNLGIDVSSISGYYNDLAINAELEYLGVFPLVSLHRRTQRVFAFAVKRAADFVLSLLALIAVAPTMVAIAIAIRLESDGPIFYVSERIGRRGRVFRCLKFRTMVSNADKLRKNVEALNERNGILFKARNDPRVTPLGRFLRKYSLDELPQFVNVLRGEMSLVGPRPPIPSEVERYELEHLRRLEVLPGLTGLWQVQAREDASFEKYIALDTAYVEHWNFWLDLKILFRTAEVVLRGTGV